MIRSAGLTVVLLRLVTVTAALVLFFVPAFIAPSGPALAGGGIGLALTALAIVTSWRWPLTTGACVFLTVYAGALWTMEAEIGIVSAVGVGVTLLLLLHSAELARAARAAVDPRVIRAQVIGWSVFSAGTFLGAVILVTLARGIAGAIPLAAAPLLAGAAAFGVIVALAAALGADARRSRQRAERTSR